MSKEKDPLLIEDHEYDGIQELDNKLPNWWLWTFLISIAFAFFYWIHYTVSESGPSSDLELAQAMSVIEKQRDQQSESSEDGAGVDLAQNGGKIFKNYCASCHGSVGEGGIGPNLTDKYWVHGKGDAASITKIAADGVLEKGMPAWKALLKPSDLKAITVFILSLKGSKPANAKEPQGELVSE